MKVLVLLSLYPNDVQRRHGIFIEHRVAHLSTTRDSLQVIAPVPWFPFKNPIFGRYADFARTPCKAVRRDTPISYPRYPVLPKVGMSMAPWLMAAALYRHVASLRQKFNFDVIDSYYLYPDGVAASLLARWFNRPYLMTALGSDVSLIPRFPRERRMIVRAVERAYAVTAVCGALRDELVSIGVASDKVHVVEHGVDLDMFRPPEDRRALRRSLGMDGPTLLSVGHLIDRKGHDLAIRAVAALPGVRLMIAGDGPRDRALRALAMNLGVGDRVEFLGHVDQERLPGLYGAADIALNCADREGIANVLLEAIACGTPLVATPVWGSPEVVKVREAGLLTADRSVPAISDAIARLLAALPERAATRRYAESYDWRRTGREHRALLQAAVM